MNEPLETSWLLAQEWAIQCCSDCGWYHGFWQYLRLLGMGKTLSGQSTWFIEQIRTLRSLQQPVSILISGCADYSAFAHVIDALDLTRCELSNQPRIVAVDRCQTPLRLNHLLSQHTGVAVTGIKADVLSFDSQERFDLIFTSSFLGFFNPQARQRLFRRYHDLLKPRGRLVFANRLRAGDESVPVSPSEEAISRTISTALELHRTAQLTRKMHEETFVQNLTRFMHNNLNYPLSSVRNVTTLLNMSGLTRHDITLRQPDLPPGVASVHLAGASLAEKASYVCVVAERGA